MGLTVWAIEVTLVGLKSSHLPAKLWSPEAQFTYLILLDVVAPTGLDLQSKTLKASIRTLPLQVVSTQHLGRGLSQSEETQI
jgi:hypothetical protein